ncbi:MAG TPA: hypothetical protein VLD85_01535 [Anaeromyxobacteraceae bacterium]|nr:hypothetical protein [Anaeromyxobacteraceae bacterium]
MPCPRAQACGLPEVVTIVLALRRWQAEYCEHDFGSCERLKRAERGEPIPDRMLPNGFVLPAPA